jgi:hypothetical protein
MAASLRSLGAATFLSGAMLISPDSVKADSRCVLLPPDSQDLTDWKPGTIPYFNGELSYDSRRQIVEGEPQYVWSITENSTGYAVEVKWGSANNDQEYLQHILVKDGNASPRCRAKSSDLDPSTSILDPSATLRVLSYKRKGGFFPWEKEEPQTVFEVVNLGERLRAMRGRLSRAVFPYVLAQTSDESARLRAMFLSGMLPASVQAYYEPTQGLDVRALIRDPVALKDYFSLGYSRISNFDIVVTDFPIDANALKQMFAENEIDSSRLTPIYILVRSEIVPTEVGGTFMAQYTFYSELIADEVPEEFNPEAFQGMNLRLAPSSELSNNEAFRSVLESEGGFNVAAKPGMGNSTTVEAQTGQAFEAANMGSLSLLSIEGEIPILRFETFSVSAQ